MSFAIPWKRGEKVRVALPVSGLSATLPATAVAGHRDGPTLVVTGGVHGGEYVGIEAAIRFARRLDPSELSGRVLVVHLTNPPAFWAKLQYLNPLDGKNLNRVFPGNADGSASERIAAAVVEQARGADAWIDLHSGDIHEALAPFTIYAERDDAVGRRAREMAEAFGIPRLVASSSIAGGTYAAAARMGMPAILAESGGVAQLDEEDVARHLWGLENVAKLWGVLPGPALPPPVAPVTYRRFEWVRSQTQGFWYRQVNVGAMVEAGQPVGTLRDAYGDPIADFPAPVAGELLFVATSVAINPDDPLFAVGAS
jgi:predicted deacylase